MIDHHHPLLHHPYQLCQKACNFAFHLVEHVLQPTKGFKLNLSKVHRLLSMQNWFPPSQSPFDSIISSASSTIWQQQQPHGQQGNKENKNNTTTTTKTTSLTWWQHYLLPGSLIGFEGRIWQQVDPGVNIAISIPEPNIIDNDDDDNDKMIEDYDHIITMHDNCRCSKPAHLKNQAIATLATHEFRCSSKFYNPTKVRDEIY